MFDLASVRVDPSKVIGGVWWRIWPTDDGHIIGEPCAADSPLSRVLIVPAGHAFDRVQGEEMQPIRERLRAKAVGEDELRALDGRVLARAVWRGAANLIIDGQQWTWSEDGAAALLNDPSMVALRKFIERVASNLAGARAEEEAKAAGN